MAEIKRQKLIHLHKSTPLVDSAATAVGMVKGEIAVRHAATNADSALYTLNDNGGIVSFPSKAYVDAQITNSNGSISGLQTKIDNIETAVGLTNDGTLAAWADGTTYITGKTTFKAAIEALDGQAKKNAEAAAAAKTEAAKHSIVKGDANITVTPSGTGQITYTLNSSKLATVTGLTAVSDRVTVIEKFFNGADKDSGDTNVIDTLKEIQTFIANDKSGAAAMTATLGNIEDVLKGYLKTGTTGSNTVIKDIIDKKADATALAAVSDTVNHIKAQAGVDGTSDSVSFDDTNYLSGAQTLKAAIEALDGQAKKNATEAAKHTKVVGANNISVSSADTNGQVTYTVNGSNLATKTALSTAEGRIKTIEDNYVKDITIVNSTARGVTATKGTNSYAINFDAMVIDCGEY